MAWLFTMPFMPGANTVKRRPTIGRRKYKPRFCMLKHSYWMALAFKYLWQISTQLSTQTLGQRILINMPTFQKINYTPVPFNNLYTVERPMLICLAMSVAPIPFSYNSLIFSVSMVHLRPNFTPLALALMRPSLVRSRMRWRSLGYG